MSNPAPLKIASMPIGSAFTWLKNAFLLLKTQPWVLCLTAAWAMLLCLLLSRVPVVGSLLVAVIFPALSFGMAHINQKIRLHERASPLDVFSGFHPAHRTRLLVVGACLAMVLFASSMLMQRFDLTALNTFAADFVKQAETIDMPTLMAKTEQAMLDPAFRRAIGIVYGFLFANAIVIALFAYAPLFVAWQHVEPVKAIGLSISIVVLNIGPLLILLVVALGIEFVLINLLAIAAMLIPFFGAWLALSALFLLTAFNYSLVFCSFHNIITSSAKNSLTNNG